MQATQGEGEGGEVMHKIDWEGLKRLHGDNWTIELVRQLDERFAKREEFEEHSKWLLSQQTAAWDRIMDHSHSAKGELVFPPTEPITVTRNMVGACSPIEEDEIQPNTVCDSEVGCVTFPEDWVVDTVTATQRGCKCPLCYSVVQPKAECNHPCHVINRSGLHYAEVTGKWAYCARCGLSLAAKEEKT